MFVVNIFYYRLFKCCTSVYIDRILSLCDFLTISMIDILLFNKKLLAEGFISVFIIKS